MNKSVLVVNLMLFVDTFMHISLNNFIGTNMYTHCNYYIHHAASKYILTFI